MRLPLSFPLYRFGCEILPKRVFGAPSPFLEWASERDSDHDGLKKKVDVNSRG